MYIREVSKEQLLQFYNRFFSVSSSKSLKPSIHLHRQGSVTSDVAEALSRREAEVAVRPSPVMIDNVALWRASMAIMDDFPPRGLRALS